jgi:hypothetical protein
MQLTSDTRPSGRSHRTTGRSALLIGAVKEGIQMQTARLREALRETAENQRKLHETADELESKLNTLEKQITPQGVVDTKYQQKLRRHKQQQNKLASISKIRQGHDMILPQSLQRRVSKQLRTTALDAVDGGRTYVNKVAHRREVNRQKLRNLFVDNSAMLGGMDKLFEFIDEDGDGSITLREFKKGISKIGWGVVLEDLSDIYTHIDKNNDDGITKQELGAFLRAHVKRRVTKPNIDTSASVTRTSHRAPAKSSKAARRPGWEKERMQQTLVKAERKEVASVEGMELLRRSLEMGDRPSMFGGRVKGPGKHPMPHTHFVPDHF